MPARIEDYAIIGDCQTAALVAKDGSLDWLCLPRFDSPACFAALLGEPEHGRWLIAPTNETAKLSRQYLPDTLILETQFETPEGIAKLTDFMPLRQEGPVLVRIVQGIRGSVEMHMELTLRFDYGQSVPWVTRMEDGSLRAIAGPNMVLVRSPVEFAGEDLKTIAKFAVKEGQSVPFVLSYRPSHLPPPEEIDATRALERTKKFWTEWTGGCQSQLGHVDAVKRSLITLKALTYWPTGGITAAPTTSLPEHLGGVRNWDYRYCWLRDASFTLRSLVRYGYYEEAGQWQDWLVRAVAGSAEQAQIMYGLAGERTLREWELPWLPGYEGAKPVRVGNAASEQFQLDVYGELAGALHHAREGDLPRNDAGVDLEWALLAHLEKVWREPDEGIWEVRGGRQQFTHSKVMAWAAFNFAIRSCEQFGLKGPVDRWRAIRQEIHDDVCEKGFNAQIGSFVQTYGGDNLDASLLRIAKVRFLPASDPRVQGTVRAIEKNLLVDGLVLRYHTHETEDGLPPGEGVFLPCSFWLADVYALMGRMDDARKLFERLLSLRNDLGLLSEEYDWRAKRLVGNFPQALSHVALVNTAFLLNREEASTAKAPSDISVQPPNRR